MKKYVLKDISKYYLMGHVENGKKSFYGWQGTIESYKEFLGTQAYGANRGGMPSEIYESARGFTDKQIKKIIGEARPIAYQGTPVWGYVKAENTPEPDHDFKCIFCGAVSKKPPCLKCYEKGQT